MAIAASEAVPCQWLRNPSNVARCVSICAARPVAFWPSSAADWVNPSGRDASTWGMVTTTTPAGVRKTPPG